MARRSRWLLIAVAVIATAVVIGVDAARRQLSSTEKKALASAGATAAAKAGSAPPPRLEPRQPMGTQHGDLFGVRSWTLPTPPQATQSAPPPPPPNPYRFAATSAQNGELRVYLADGDRVIEAKRGEVTDRGYRVVNVTREAVVIENVALGIEHRIEIKSTMTAEAGPQRGVLPRTPDAAAGR